MYKKLRKFCAWALAVVTVVSLISSSGLVMAEVGTYHILTDTGDVVDEPEISSEDKN